MDVNKVKKINKNDHQYQQVEKFQGCVHDLDKNEALRHTKLFLNSMGLQHMYCIQVPSRWLELKSRRRELFSHSKEMN